MKVLASVPTNSPRFDRRRGKTGYAPAFKELVAAAIAYADAFRAAGSPE